MLACVFVGVLVGAAPARAQGLPGAPDAPRGPATLLAGDPSGGEFVLFRANGDYRRPFFAAVRLPGSGWGAPVALSAPAACCAVLDANANGEAVVAREDYAGVYAAIAVRGATAFGSPQRLASWAPGQSPAEDVRVAIGERGDAVVAWSAGGQVMAAVRAPGSRAFASPTVVGPVAAVDSPMRSVDVNGRGDAIVRWIGAGGTFTAWRPADGAFEPAQAIPRAPFNSTARTGEQALTRSDPGPFELNQSFSLSDDGRATAVLGQFSVAPVHQVFVLTADLGAPWSSPVAVDAPVGGLSQFSAGFNGAGAGMVLWSTRSLATPSSAGAWSAVERTRGSADFTPVESPLPAAASTDCTAIVVGPLGDVAVAYSTQGASTVLITRRRGEAAWTAPQDLGTGRACFLALFDFYKRIAVGPDGDVAVATRSSDAVRAAYRGSDGVMRPMTLSPGPPTGDVVGPVLGAGRATAAWQQADAKALRVMTRDFGPGGVGTLSTVASLSPTRFGPPSACRPKGSVTVADNKLARIFSTRGRFGATMFWGCLFARGAPTILASGGIPPRLAGTKTAYAYAVYDEAEMTSTDNVTVVDLRNDASSPTQLNGHVTVPSIVLNTRGSVAWIQCSSLTGRLDQCAVYRKPSGGEMKRLAGGTKIKRGSLRLAGTRLSWLDGARRRYSTLR